MKNNSSVVAVLHVSPGLADAPLKTGFTAVRLYM